MSDYQEQPWSDNPIAPKIPHNLYFGEKANFAGVLIGSILHGTLTVLFFKCMSALLSPVHRETGSIKWKLAAYTAVMFLGVTVFTAMNLNFQSVSYIDHREYAGLKFPNITGVPTTPDTGPLIMPPGIEGVLPTIEGVFYGIDSMLLPGPLGYQSAACFDKLCLVPNFVFLLNDWLASGLLIYRCYVIYSMNLRAIALPCLMYLGSLVTGSAMFLFLACGWGDGYTLPYPYLSISVSLNVLLALMITTRLVMHSGNVRTTAGTPAGVGRLCATVNTILIESSALYAVSLLLFVGSNYTRSWNTNHPTAGIFFPILVEAQVIAPLLIIKRIAEKNALTGDTVVFG